MSDLKHNIKYISIFLNVFLAFIFLLSIVSFAKPNTVCNGKEFNKRIKTLVDGGDVVADYRIKRFERGDNPPSDSDYYIDISEDNDESVFAYYSMVKPQDKSNNEVNLYWYSTDNIFMNENAAMMFQGFTNIRYIDLTGFDYFNGLDDVRYMFKDCRNLKTLHLNSTGFNPVNGELFTPTEMQGMFYGCQSLRQIDLTKFNTYLVSNMAEMFCKCYNLLNIYVSNPNWNITSVTNFNKMFSECHLLRSTQGKKAVDIEDDDYERFAGLGINGVDSFIKDTNTEYIEYVRDDEYVPIDGQNYLMELPETMAEYGEEPEYDGQGTDQAQNNAGSAMDETGIVVDAPTAANASQTINNSISNTEAMQMLENVTTSNDTITEDIVETESESIEQAVTEESNGKKIVELDEYLNANGDLNKQDKNIIEVLWEDYQPLVIALLIAIFVLLLLIGMVLYLYKEKKNNNDNDKAL